MIDPNSQSDSLAEFLLASLDAIHKFHVGPLIQKLQGGPGTAEARAIRSAHSELDLCIRQWDQGGYRPKAIA